MVYNHSSTVLKVMFMLQFHSLQGPPLKKASFFNAEVLYLSLCELHWIVCVQSFYPCFAKSVRMKSSVLSFMQIILIVFLRSSNS